jgi:hypothetical protein
MTRWGYSGRSQRKVENVGGLHSGCWRGYIGDVGGDNVEDLGKGRATFRTWVGLRRRLGQDYIEDLDRTT